LDFRWVIEFWSQNVSRTIADWMFPAKHQNENFVHDLCSDQSGWLA
jgi:hypothetical protein